MSIDDLGGSLNRREVAPSLAAAEARGAGRRGSNTVGHVISSATLPIGLSRWQIRAPIRLVRGLRSSEILACRRGAVRTCMGSHSSQGVQHRARCAVADEANM